MKLHGIFPPLTTPFGDHGELALERLSDNVARYNRTRLAGYVVTGSTGEAVLLSRDEMERVWVAARDAASLDKVLIAGTGTDSTKETIERTNRAASLGYHAALVKTPHYYKPQINDRLLAEHFLRVADAARMPILVYCVPQFTGVWVRAELMHRLAQHPNIIGIKESSGDVGNVSQIVAAVPPGCQVLVGSAQTLWPSVAVGAVGGILGLACVLPELCVELYEAACRGDGEQARALQQRLTPAAVTIVARLGIVGIKYGMEIAGYYGGPARSPLLPLTEAEAREVETVLARAAPPPAAQDFAAHAGNPSSTESLA